MKILLTILIGVILNVSGVVVGKYLTLNFGDIVPLISLLILYIFVQIARLVFWYLVGKRYQLSYIYPTLSINYPFAFFLGIAIFNESFEVGRLIGSLVIVMGVIIMSFSKSREELSVV